MLKAIFDRNSNLSAWFDHDDNNIFDKSMHWIGFVNGNYFFDKECNLLGSYSTGTFADKKGHPVGWLEGTVPYPTVPITAAIPKPLRPLTPITPIRPLNPLRPIRPLTPIGGWSQLTWNEYIHTCLSDNAV